MLFSLITCTYNRAEDLRKTLESVSKQTYSSDDYEIVVVDNNSTDNTVEIVKQISEKYSDRQIRYFKEANQGLSFALNKGIEEAKGDYILYIDDDETIRTEHLSFLEKYLTKYSDTVLAASPVIPLYEIEEPKWMSPFTQRLIGGYFNEGRSVKKLPKGKYPGTGHTIIKRELYQQFGKYNTNLGRKGTGLMGAEDKDMAFRLMKQHIECYYFPDIPIFHHIPSYKLTDEFFSALTHSIGKSERIRTRAVSNNAYKKRLLDEGAKWAASLVLFAFYFVSFRPSKGIKLLAFRYNVTRGLLASNEQ